MDQELGGSEELSPAAEALLTNIVEGVARRLFRQLTINKKQHENILHTNLTRKRTRHW